jgi:hypothetical protein
VVVVVVWWWCGGGGDVADYFVSVRGKLMA